MNKINVIDINQEIHLSTYKHVQTEHTIYLIVDNFSSLSEISITCKWLFQTLSLFLAFRTLADPLIQVASSIPLTQQKQYCIMSS